MSVDAPPAPLEAAAFGPAEFAAATGATPAQMADLERFRDLLAQANQHMNLVGPSALADFWLRHAYDSAQLLTLEPGARVWADLGAGAGFPGVVLAILLKATPDARVHLIESMAKRCVFLRELVAALGIPAEVHHGRAEALKSPRGVEIVTARACAPLSRLLGYAWPAFTAGARGAFLKGRGVEEELTDARRTWRFRAQLAPSLSDPSGRIVRIESLARA